VVIDGAGGRLTGFGLGRGEASLDLAVLPGAGGGTPTLAILVRDARGITQAIRRDAATGAGRGRVTFASDLDPVSLVALPGGAYDRIAVVGRDASGALVAIARRAAGGRLAVRLTLSPTLVPVDAIAVAGPGGDLMLVVVAADAATGSVQVFGLDPVSGAQKAAFSVSNLAAARAAAPLGDVGGGPAADMAILGTAGDGTVIATVIDPLTGSLLAAPEFPGGYLTDGLVALGPGGPLAALGRAPGDASVLVVRHAVTGAPLAIFPVF
jgi:hypothetical protein